MKTLEKLSTFQSKAINKDMMAKIRGGLATTPPEDPGTCTGSGTYVRAQGTPYEQTVKYSSDCSYKDGGMVYNREDGPNDSCGTN